MRHVRYVWAQPRGKVAALAVVVGSLGLLTHFWLPGLFLLALPNRREMARWSAC